jgi:hypothetical protein
LVVLRQARKRLVTISVTSNPTAEWIGGQVTDAFPWDEAPHHLVRDRDGAFGPVPIENLNPDVLMMDPAEDRYRSDAAELLDPPKIWSILIQ